MITWSTLNIGDAVCIQCCNGASYAWSIWDTARFEWGPNAKPESCIFLCISDFIGRFREKNGHFALDSANAWIKQYQKDLADKTTDGSQDRYCILRNFDGFCLASYWLCWTTTHNRFSVWHWRQLLVTKSGRKQFVKLHGWARITKVGGSDWGGIGRAHNITCSKVNLAQVMYSTTLTICYFVNFGRSLSIMNNVSSYDEDTGLG